MKRNLLPTKLASPKQAVYFTASIVAMSEILMKQQPEIANLPKFQW